MMLSASRVVTCGAAIVPLRALGRAAGVFSAPALGMVAGHRPRGAPPAPQSWGERRVPDTQPADWACGPPRLCLVARVLLPPGLGAGGAPGCRGARGDRTFG